MKNGASSAFAPFPSATLDAGHRVTGDDVLGARERTRRGTGLQQRTGSEPTQAAADGESSPDPLQGQAEEPELSTFDNYRDAQPPTSSLQSTTKRKPKTSLTFSPAFAFPVSSLPVRSTPPHTSSSSSPVTHLVARADLAPAVTASALPTDRRRELDTAAEDSPDPLRLVPVVPSAPASRASLAGIPSKGKGKQAARSRSASVEPRMGGSLPGEPVSHMTSTGKREMSTTPRPSGGASALDGAEENVGFAATRDTFSVAEEEGQALADPTGVLRSNREGKGMKNGAGKGKAARRSSTGSFASHTLDFDLQVPIKPSTPKDSPRLSSASNSPAPPSSFPAPAPFQPPQQLSPVHDESTTFAEPVNICRAGQFPQPFTFAENSAAAPSSDLTSLPATVLATSPDRDAAKRMRIARKGYETSSDAAESSASPKKRQRVPRVPSARTKRTAEGARASGSDTSRSASATDVSAAVLSSAFSPPKRRRAVKAPVKEATSSEGESEEEYREAPAKKAKQVAGRGKGKGKAASKELARTKSKARESVSTPQSSPTSAASPASSPNKLSAPLGSQASSVFARQLAAKSVAPRETADERAKGWSLNKMDQLVWARVETESTGFWWPGDIINPLRSERPLVISLLMDDDEEILNFAPTRELVIFEPSHLNLLSFRAGPKLRFDKLLFLDQDAPSEALPSPNLFDNVLGKAVELETLRGQEDAEEDLPMSSGFKSTAPQLQPGSPLKGRADESESDDEEAQEADVEEDEEGSDAELLREADESAGFTFPTVVLARYKRQWWGARLLGYKPPPSPTKGSKKKVAGKFTVEWVDATITEVDRSDILTSLQPAFFTVKMGTTLLDLPSDYTATLVSHTQGLFDIYQRIIDEDYPPAKEWNDQFYEGGKARDALAKKARFGELQDQHTEALQQEITRWSRGLESARPTGSDRYEALSEVERNRYVTDVLLALTVFLVIIHEHDFEDRAMEQLAEEGQTLPSADDVIVRAFALASDEFERGSIQKSILAARSAKQTADASKSRRRH